MYTPFTISIYRGALSPVRLQELHPAPGQLMQAARLLEHADPTPESLCACVSLLLPGYRVSPLSPAGADACGGWFACPPASAPAGSSSMLHSLRRAEMEYMALTGSFWTPHNPLSAFYAALLQAEGRMLLRWLAQILPRLHGAEEARVLICRVLDEIYLTGAVVGDVQPDDADAWWRLMLKEGMAALYLGVTADFSYLLEADDFLNCPALFSTPAYAAIGMSGQPAFSRSVLLHDVHIKGNKIRRLLSLRGRSSSQPALLEELQACYRYLQPLWPLLQDTPSSRTHLLSMLRVIEDVIYLATCPYSHTLEPDYLQLQDAAWNCQQADDLYDRYYSTHYCASQSRSAARMLEKSLCHRSLTFLAEDSLPTGSLPRLLKQRMLHHLACYTRRFDATFRPLMPDQGFAEAPAPALHPEPSQRDVHRRLSFFTDRTDTKGHPLMQPHEVERLELLFLDFLRGRLPQEQPRKFTIPKQFNHIFYGFFFCFQQELGGDKKLYAHFLVGVFVTDSTVGSLVKNYSHYIKAYEKYAEAA